MYFRRVKTFYLKRHIFALTPAIDNTMQAPRRSDENLFDVGQPSVTLHRYSSNNGQQLAQHNKSFITHNVTFN